MDTRGSQIKNLVAHPAESLNVEIKRWIDPRTPEGKCKIIRAAMALRNRNGGFLIIGFDDKTLQPVEYDLQQPVREIFHVDEVQGLISRYSHDPFEVTVHFVELNDVEYPVIAIPSGVVAPVAVKRDLKGDNGVTLLGLGDVYFRTLNSNGTPSTSKAMPGDWKVILDICFDNREADIGRFLRRHLVGSARTDFFVAIEKLQGPTLQERAYLLLENGEIRARDSFAQRDPDGAPPPNAGVWSVAMIIDQRRTDPPTRTFLQTVLGANPQLTGWPIWLDPTFHRSQLASDH